MDYEQNQNDRQENINENPMLDKLSNHRKVRAKKEKKSGGFWKFILGILLFFSVVANGLMLVILIGVIAMMSTSGSTGGDFYSERVIQPGDSEQKIAVIRLEGMITDELAEEFRRQMKKVAKDKMVKAVIVRTISPGGGVGASDRIYNCIKDYRETENKPVVAFMQTVAASGGYYTSVACDKIVAEPTVITGSIGVISAQLMMRDMFEEKLGIKPLVIRSGPKKAWPSMLDPEEEGQKEYLMDQLITPAFDRFVELVELGRPELDIEQVTKLADGSIYFGTQALENKLVDEIGYMAKAIETAGTLAGLENPHVVEVYQPFSFASFLQASSRSSLEVTQDVVRDLVSPKLMYLYDGWAN